MRKRLVVLATFLLASNWPAVSSAYPNDSKIIAVHYTQLAQEARKQVDCLSDNIYYEAGYEPEQGRLAVAMVTMNRTRDPRFPKDICSVVKQRVKSTCQFSWFCEKKRLANRDVYEHAREVAVMVYANYEKLHDMTKGALYYHADYVNPRWKLEKTTKIGRHIFYK